MKNKDQISRDGRSIISIETVRFREFDTFLQFKRKEKGKELIKTIF